jgi:hypothetical protein
MKKLSILRANLLYFLWLVSLSGCAGSVGTQKQENMTIRPESTKQSIAEWPLLPTVGFIRGRAASEKDVNDGNAVFVAAESNGTIIGKPLQIEIPQYAYWDDEESGDRLRVIVIQAELAKGYEMIGFKNIETGELGAGLRQEFELLGTKIPSTDSHVP